MRFLRRLLLGYDYRFGSGWYVSHSQVVAARKLKKYSLVYLTNGLVIRHDNWKAAVQKGMQLI